MSSALFLARGGGAGAGAGLGALSRPAWRSPALLPPEQGRAWQSGATAAAEVCDGAAATGAATTAGIQFTANVSGRTATGQPGQSCMETGTDDASGDVITQNLTFESYKFTVSSDGTTATQTFAGADNYNDVTTGNQLSCLFTETAALSM